MTSHSDEPGPGLRRYDALAAAVASLISLLALAVSGYSTYWQRQQIRVQTWPRLTLQLSETNEPRERAWTLKIQNVGIGPAEVGGAEVRVDGQPVHTWAEMAQKLVVQKL